MAGVATGTRERQPAPPGAELDAFAQEGIGALLTAGNDDSDGDDGAAGEFDEDELGPDEDDGDEGEDSDDGEAGADESDDEDEPGTGAESAQAGEGPESYVEAWAAKVLAKPGLLAQVPTNRRTAVVTSAISKAEAQGRAAEQARILGAAEQAVQAAYRKGMEDAEATRAVAEEDEEMEELAQADPAEFGRMVAAGEEKALAFVNRRKAAVGGGGEELMREAERVVAPVKGNQAVMAQLAANHQKQPYVGASGLARLSADVAVALAEEARKAAEPKKKLAGDRAAAAQKRERLPRASGGGSAGSSGGGGAPGNPDDWLVQGFIETANKRGKGN